MRVIENSYDEIDEFLDKYRCLLSMARISENGCTIDDIVYKQFMFGKITVLKEVIKDLEELKNKKNRK